MSDAKTLVVVPCLNEEDHIGKVLEAILRDPRSKHFSIYVADGGSTDRTREIVSRMAESVENLRLVDNPARLQSAGVNAVARSFAGDHRWLVRLDAHAEYPSGYISQLIREAENTGASSIVVAMRSIGCSCFQRAAATAQNSVLGTGGSAHRRNGSAGFVDHGHHALFDLKKFLALGGYDERQSHNEDAEYDFRLARSGGRIWLTRATEIAYFPRSSPAALFRQYRNYGRGRATTLRRHGSRVRVRQLLPAAVAPSLMLACLAVWFPIAALPAALWASICLSYGFALGSSRKSVCACASGFAALVMHLGWSFGFWSGLLYGPPAPKKTRPVIAAAE